jgi:hypothetical protein
MSKHVHHRIPAYVHHQLSRRERDRVLLHVRNCNECWDKLVREQELARDILSTMPLIGTPAKDQLAKVRTNVLSDLRTSRSPRIHWIPSYGLMLAVFIMCVFAITALLSGPTQVIAAPFQKAPMEITATATLVRTDEPKIEAEASETANPNNKPMPSPAPVIGLIGQYVGH